MSFYLKKPNPLVLSVCMYLDTGPSTGAWATSLENIDSASIHSHRLPVDSQMGAGLYYSLLVTKIHGPSALVKFLRVQSYGACRDSPSKVKDKLLHLAPPTTKKAALHLVGLFGICRQHIPHLGVLPWLVYQVTPNALVVNALLNRKRLSTGPGPFADLSAWSNKLDRC